MDKIDLIREMCKYLKKQVHTGESILPRTDSFDKHISEKHQRKEEIHIYLTAKNKLSIYSYDESRHNGSSYNDDHDEIDFPEILQYEVLEKLRKEYEEYEFCRIEENQERHRKAAIRAQIVKPEERFSV